MFHLTITLQPEGVVLHLTEWDDFLLLLEFLFLYSPARIQTGQPTGEIFVNMTDIVQVVTFPTGVMVLIEGSVGKTMRVNGIVRQKDSGNKEQWRQKSKAANGWERGTLLGRRWTCFIRPGSAMWKKCYCRLYHFQQANWQERSLLLHVQRWCIHVWKPYFFCR